MTEHEDLVEWLERDEGDSRPSRAERLRLLIDEYGPDGIRVFHGGPVSALAFEEARQAYLHGLFLSCTIMCQVCLEHMLAGLLFGLGRNEAGHSSFENLLRQARQEQLLSDAEFETFDRLRVTRNPYSHFTPPGSPRSVMHRAVSSALPFDALVAKDAHMAITALLRLCRRPPFALQENPAS